MSSDAELTLILDTPEPLAVVAAHVLERISVPTAARVELASALPLRLEDVLEKDATLVVAPFGGLPRRWTLRVGHVDFIRIVDGSMRYIAQLFPAFWLLRFTKNQRKFTKLSAEAIISKILAEHQVAHRFELARPTETRKYCVQYSETNLDFISRLLEFEGIHYAFEDDGTMVLSDRSEDAPKVAGESAFDLVEVGGAMEWTRVGLREFTKERKVTSGAATVNDFNWKKPKVKLLASASAKEDAELEVYDYPVGFRRSEQGPILAQRRLEAYRVAASQVTGTGNVHSFAPARSFTFGALASPRFAGEYLIVGVEHRYRNGKFEHVVDGQASSGISYENTFAGIPKKVPFRPPLVTPQPHIAGTHTAMVRGPAGEEIHTDVHGRFCAQFHWDREATRSDEDSRWLRNVQETANGTALARVGWEQSVAYINGDPDRPIGIARNINGQMTAEYAQPANKTRHTMKSPSYPSASGGFNELRMEDLGGLMHMDWHGEKDFNASVDNDRTYAIAANETKSVGANYSTTVVNDQRVEVGGNYTANVGGVFSFSVEADREKKIAVDQKLTITEVYSHTIAGNDLEKVDANRTVEAAEKSGSITRQVVDGFERSVGEWEVTGKGSLELLVQDTLKETVAGTKTVEVEDGGISLRVGGKFDLKISADATRAVKTKMGYSAKTTSIASGSALFQGGEKIAINGDKILLVADESLEFTSGGAGLKLDPKSIAFKGKLLIDAKRTITVTGNKDNLTK